jgi:hypothetical protein
MTFERILIAFVLVLNATLIRASNPVEGSTLDVWGALCGTMGWLLVGHIAFRLVRELYTLHKMSRSN